MKKASSIKNKFKKKIFKDKNRKKTKISNKTVKKKK